MFEKVKKLDFKKNESTKEIVSGLATLYMEFFKMSREDAERLVEKKMNHFKDDFLQKVESAEQYNFNKKHKSHEEVNTEDYLTGKTVIKG